MFEKVLLILPFKVVNPTTIPTPMRDAINAYSIAVAPDSLERNFLSVVIKLILVYVKWSLCMFSCSGNVLTNG